MLLKDSICNGCLQYRKSMFDDKGYCLLVPDPRKLFINRGDYQPHVPKNCERTLEYTVLTEGKVKYINRSIKRKKSRKDFNYEYLVGLLQDMEHNQYNNIIKFHSENNYFPRYDDICLAVYKTFFGENTFNYSMMIEKLINLNDKFKNVMIYGISYGGSDRLRRNLKKRNGILFSSIITNKRTLNKYIDKAISEDVDVDIVFLPHVGEEATFPRYEFDMFVPLIERNWKKKKPFFAVVYG